MSTDTSNVLTDHLTGSEETSETLDALRLVDHRIPAGNPSRPPRKRRRRPRG